MKIKLLKFRLRLDTLRQNDISTLKDPLVSRNKAKISYRSWRPQVYVLRSWMVTLACFCFGVVGPLDRSVRDSEAALGRSGCQMESSSNLIPSREAKQTATSDRLPTDVSAEALTRITTSL